MTEPSELSSARQHLSRAEADFRSEDGLFHLEEGLALLEEVIESDVPRDRTVAKNLATTYSARIYASVKRLIETDRALPEPELEHLFKVLLAFDQVSFDLPAEARSTKITIARRLLDRYYEGHAPEAKRRALEQLMEISGGKSKQEDRKERTKTQRTHKGK